jgi:hypothetical protein
MADRELHARQSHGSAPGGRNWKVSILIEPLHRQFDVSPYSTSRISLMRWGYSPFTHQTFVSRPSAGCQTSTIRMLASFQKISRHDGRRTRVERANPRPFMVCCPRRVSRPPLGRPSWRLPFPVTHGLQAQRLPFRPFSQLSSHELSPARRPKTDVKLRLRRT